MILQLVSIGLKIVQLAGQFFGFQTTLLATPTTRSPADDQFWHLCDVENYVICMKTALKIIKLLVVGSRSIRQRDTIIIIKKSYN